MEPLVTAGFDNEYALRELDAFPNFRRILRVRPVASSKPAVLMAGT